MRVYQCIHKYGPHIPLFEKKYGVTDEMDFETLRKLIVQDGYASTYVLLPALQQKSDEVFYTIWNYERLQLLWASEHGLRSNDLDEIKLAQIEEYRPDVFYNMSAYYDRNFIKKLGKRNDRKDVYWNGIIEKQPRTYFEYDGQLTLHRPYVKYWEERGLAASELQPGIPETLALLSSENKPIDVLFYGQYTKAFFGNRNKIIEQLLRYKQESGKNIRCHLQYSMHRPTLFRVPRLSWTRIHLPIVTFPSKFVRENAMPPLYGESLYKAIGQAKIVVNAYGDCNHDFKSNMRLFESIGLGAFLITEEGNYPSGFEPGVDFYTYRNVDELFSQITRVLANWPKYEVIARRTQEKITSLYSKERQWVEFQNFIGMLK